VLHSASGGLSHSSPNKVDNMKRLGTVAAMLMACFAAQAQQYNIEWDNFKSDFSANTSSSRWFYFAAGPYIGNDGVETTSNRGLHVAPPGINASTGRPAFTLTLGQEHDPVANPFGLPAGLDHVKWLVYANHLSTAGYPGFDTAPGHELRFDCWMSGESFGNEFHPFSAAVEDPDDDIRLACAAMPTIDFETFLVADFFLTNRRIYVVYERLPFARTPTNNYASFTYAIPVADRKPHEQHHLTIGYNPSTSILRWLIDDVEVYRITQPGHRLPSREFMILDHGGDDELVVCRQRNTGLGMFTLLDAASPTQQALVQLSSQPGFYFSTAQGGPVPQTFLDPASTPVSRLWGAGAELRVRRVRISNQLDP
jgi:hypothetical protein